MKATVVVDNRGNGILSGEWGLCIYIEHGEKHILLDTGASDLFVQNAEKLGLDLTAVDAAVLSHAHYDHANGLEAFFRCNSRAKFYVGHTCRADCYYKKLFLRRYIGVPKTVLQDFRNRIVYAGKEPTEILPGVYLAPHKTAGLARVGRRENMYRRANGRWIPDDFSHEQSLVLDTEKGLVIFNSCSHGGAADIIREVARRYMPSSAAFIYITNPSRRCWRWQRKFSKPASPMCVPGTAPGSRPISCCIGSWVRSCTRCRWAWSWSFKKRTRRKSEC